MINQNKWINSLPKINNRFDEEISQLNNNIWIDTIPKKKTHAPIKKYSLVAILFFSGLLLTSAVKNETRNLQKEINNLKASIYDLKFNLNQAMLDNEVITSPENISQLAEEHLGSDFVFYKKSQIKHINEKTENPTEVNKKIKKEKNKNFSTSIKTKVAKKIEEKKVEIRKLQTLYSQPKSIPREIKTQVAKKIEEKKAELKNLYSSPKETVTLGKAQKWVAVQLVKTFLGMPIIPGK